MAPRNLLIALIAAVLLVVAVISSVDRRTTSGVGSELPTAPEAGSPAAGSIAPPAGTSPDAGATRDASGMAPGVSPESAVASGQDPLPPDHGDPAAKDVSPTSMSPEADLAGAGPSADSYPTSVEPVDPAPDDATPAADPLPTSLPEDQADWLDAATVPGEVSPSPTSTDSAAGPPAASDATQRSRDAHPTDEQLSPTG